jgi:hypothetical protein
VNAFDDLAPLIQRERPFGYVDFGDRHAPSFFIGEYIATLGLGQLGVKLNDRAGSRHAGRPGGSFFEPTVLTDVTTDRVITK